MGADSSAGRLEQPDEWPQARQRPLPSSFLPEPPREPAPATALPVPSGIAVGARALRRTHGRRSRDPCVNARLTSAASFATLETRWSTPSPAVASCCSRLSALSSLRGRGDNPDAAGALAR